MKPTTQDFRCSCCFASLKLHSMFFAYDKAFCSPKCRNHYIIKYHEANTTEKFRKISI